MYILIYTLLIYIYILVLYFYFGNGTMVSLFHFSTYKSGFYVMSFFMAWLLSIIFSSIYNYCTLELTMLVKNNALAPCSHRCFFNNFVDKLKLNTMILYKQKYFVCKGYCISCIHIEWYLDKCSQNYERLKCYGN